MSVCSDSGAKWILVGSFIWSIICKRSFLSNEVDGTVCGDESDVVSTGGGIRVVGGSGGGAFCVEGHCAGILCTRVGGTVFVVADGTEVCESVVFESRSIRLDDNVDDDADEYVISGMGGA